MKVPTPHAVLPAGRSAVQCGLKKLILYDPGGVRRSPSEEPISYFLSCESFKTKTIRVTHLFFYGFAIAIETIGLGLVAVFHFHQVHVAGFAAIDGGIFPTFIFRTL